MTPSASQNFVAPRLSATSRIGMATRNAPMFGRNSPKNANTPNMSAGCTPINQSNTPMERPVITPLFAITIGREREIPGDQRSRVGQHENEQQNREHGTDEAADQTNCRS